MSAKTKNRPHRKKKGPDSSFVTITYIVILISILAAAMFYFFYFSQKRTENKKAIPHATTTPIKNAAPASQNVLNGTWVSSADGRLLDIHGNRFTLELPSVSDHEITKGTIKINGNTATILYTGTKDKCSIQSGSYSFFKGKGTLRFSVIHDVCAGRKQIFSTTWEKF